MKMAERIIMVLLVLTLAGGGAWLYFSIQHEEQELRDAVARGEFEIREPEEPEPIATTTSSEEEWRIYYPTLVPVTIGSTSVMASVADSLPERIKGLSDTPYLPDGIVKLFAFGTSGEHSIWMKDMFYAIDIIWVAENGTIVHLKEHVSPETFPESFGSPKPAFYVIEANAGFAEKNNITVGDKVVIVLPEQS
jgi:uncharacterized membrane protein (UPF0127 family)